MVKFIVLTMGILMLGVTACASIDLDAPPTLKNRRLRISDKVAGFEYQYRVCAKKFIVCTRWETKTDYYDLTIPEIRAELKAMGFIALVEAKPGT